MSIGIGRMIASVAALISSISFSGSGAQASVIVLSGVLDAAQVVDGGGSTSTATAFAMLSINTGAATLTLAAESLTVDFNWTGLSGPADRAHLHDAPAGVSRLVTDPFDAFFDEVFYTDNPLRTIDCSSWSSFVLCVPASGTLHFVQALSDVIDFNPGCDPTGEVCSVATLVNMALTDDIYLDMHTQTFPSGEIRGQLLVVPEPAILWLLACPAFLLLRRRSAVRLFGRNS